MLNFGYFIERDRCDRQFFIFYDRDVTDIFYFLL